MSSLVKCEHGTGQADGVMRECPDLHRICCMQSVTGYQASGHVLFPKFDQTLSLVRAVPLRQTVDLL